MEGRGVECTVEEPILDKLVEFAWARRSEGARTVRRLITAYLRDQIVDGLGRIRNARCSTFALKTTVEITALDR